jgi:hypothetical protein
MNSLRSWLYWWARVIGDLQAIRRGPNAIVRRLVRKAVGRQAGRLLRRI